MVWRVFLEHCWEIIQKHTDQQALAAQPDDGIYAGALEKLYRENQLPAVNVNDRQTHPHLYDRMTAAGVTPDYPRPERPERVTMPGLVYSIALGVLVALMLKRID